MAKTDSKTVKTKYPGLYKLVGEDGVQLRDMQGRLKWVIKVPVGEQRGKDGKMAYRRLTHRFAGLQRDALAVQEKLKNEARSGVSVSKRNMTLEEFFEVWLKHREKDADAKEGEQPKASAETIKRNVRDMSLVLERVGGKPIRKIDSTLVEETLADIKRNGRVKGEGCLSAATMSKIHKAWKKVMAYALKQKAILSNPFDDVKAPKLPETDREPLDDDECLVLHDFLDMEEERVLSELEAKEDRIVKLREKPSYNDDRGHVRGITHLGDIIAVRVLFNTGMRRGEVMALQWDCVNLGAEPYIRVKQSLTRELRIKPPKTEGGKRDIPIDADLARRLRRWKNVQKKYLRGVDVNGKLPVFCSSTGSFQGVNNFERFWRGFRSEAGLDGVLLHELRHTWATNLVHAGAPLVEVMYLGGWTDPRVPEKIYSHAKKKEYVRHADVMANVVRNARAERKRDGFHAIKSA